MIKTDYPPPFRHCSRFALFLWRIMCASVRGPRQKLVAESLRFNLHKIFILEEKYLFLGEVVRPGSNDGLNDFGKNAENLSISQTLNLI